MIDCRFLQRLQRRSTRDPVSLNNSLRVNALVDELLRLSEDLRREHTNAGSPVADFIVLDLRDIDEDLRSCVIQLDRLKNRRAIVCNVDVAGRS